MLHVHRAERADVLAGGLAELLSEPPDDALAREVVSVPARGVERWLAQRLSHALGVGPSGGDGVCAAVDFPPPGRLVGQAVAAASEVDPDEDPWAPGRLVWQLLAVVDACAHEEWCVALGGHLGLGAASGDDGAEVRRARRLGVAAHLVGLLASYGSARPQMLRDWAEGRDGDGAGGRLPRDLAWQAELWRRLRDRVGTPSPAERLPRVADVLAEDPDRVDLPGRLSVFGATRLAADELAVLAALAERREVHLWLPHPSPALWDAVAALPPGGAQRTVPVRRAHDPSVGVVRHPLLGSLGRDSRELQLRLPTPAGGRSDTHHPLRQRPAGLLGLLQEALAADRPPPGVPLAGAPDARAVLDPADTSVQVHSCHGPARQVEVLREVLLGLLADAPTLSPRDVLVACPDVETYAPLVSAAFGLPPGAGEAHPGHRLRVRLADRSPIAVNPVLDVLATVLRLADARLTVADVLDLAAAPPVARRFRLDADDTERLARQCADAGVRWALDAEHRLRVSGVPGSAQGTWRAGLDRLLLGVAVAPGTPPRWLGRTLPVEESSSTDVAALGRLAELVDRLSCTVDGLQGAQPVARWVEVLRDALASLVEVPPDAVWQVAQAERVLSAVLQESGDGTTVLRLEDVRTLLADRLAARPTRSGFRTGSLTVCTLVPMRSVPHRVVCLLGLDDGRFPRAGAPDGDDLLAREPCAGERDARSEDRQLLLDAVLSATERLVVLHSGADPRTGAARAPAVPLGELLDTLDATARTADGRPASAQVVVRHPLQPFDARCFVPGALGRPGPFSHDGAVLRGARAARAERPAAPVLLPAPLPEVGDAAVELDDVVALLLDPMAGFLRQRLGAALPRDSAEPPASLPLELDGLERWAVADRLLADLAAGADPRVALDAERRRGALPPGPLGSRTLADVEPRVRAVHSAAASLLAQPARAVDVAVALPGGRRLVGTVPQVRGTAVAEVTVSTLAAKHRLRAWVRLLALQASAPAVTWTAVTSGRTGRDRAARSVLGPVPPSRAVALLADLVALRDLGLCEPLPLPLVTGERYAVARAAGVEETPALERARDAWEGAFDRPGENDDEGARRVLGAAVPLETLLLAPTRADDEGPSDESTRFGALARRLWEPLLAAERTERP